MDRFTEEFARTGERQLLERVVNCGIDTIFDVGANRGHWSIMANEILPQATVYAFEIIPHTFDHLVDAVRGIRAIHPNSVGLSDRIGITPVKYCTSDDTCSTSLERLAPGTVATSQYHWVDAITITGDAYKNSRGIPRVNMVKIDTEGAEHLVLNGMQKMLSEGCVDIVQFEYGTANIVSRWMLMDAYELLQPYGFKLGRLSPAGVDFSPYYLTMEDFNGPNYVAVHSSRLDIVDAIKAS